MAAGTDSSTVDAETGTDDGGRTVSRTLEVHPLIVAYKSSSLGVDCSRDAEAIPLGVAPIPAGIIVVNLGEVGACGAIEESWIPVLPISVAIDKSPHKDVETFNAKSVTVFLKQRKWCMLMSY